MLVYQRVLIWEAQDPVSSQLLPVAAFLAMGIPSYPWPNAWNQAVPPGSTMSWLRFPFWLLHILIVVNHNFRVLWYPSLADERNIRFRFYPCHFMFGTHKSPYKTCINTHAPIYYRTISQSLNQVSLILKLEIPSLITFDINYMGLLWE